jgi:acyl-coenzyme A thioesterase PaaI-like protein
MVLVRGRRDAALARIIEGVPLLAVLGLRCDRRGGELTAVLPFRDEVIGHPLLPTIHGGVTAAFLETAARDRRHRRACPIGRLGRDGDGGQPPGARPPLPKTIGLTVDDLRPGLPRDASARAGVNRPGRRCASVHVQIWQDLRDKPCAQATGHFLMPERA